MSSFYPNTPEPTAPANASPIVNSAAVALYGANPVAVDRSVSAEVQSSKRIE